ncbi:MAG: oxygen-independent coproporphyrinogen III oxidase [Chloroflexi bacterium]|nr:MAG: oxygen-independent coproporphyrinogen III oxidase [Chloroflexota bacterium]MBA4374753.1 coproporphyrinogen III oxidase [Anaerolinea sp.]
MVDTSIYFHIPFCNRRCGYCDFNTFAGMKKHIPAYVDALCQEVIFIGEQSLKAIKVGTVFFGGGTPSLLNAQQLGKILEATSTLFEVDPEAEITLEANPGTVTLKYLKELRSIGINRISLGMQSAHPTDLRILDREHTHQDVIRSVQWSQQAGFERINLDLIFGIPGQTLDRWKETLDLALMESIDHFSLYSLSVEEGTPLNRWINSGLLLEPDDDLAAAMYEYAGERLAQGGFAQYEISNWATSRGKAMNAKCRHNLQYWRYLPYLGFGAGAHGFYDGVRTENESKIIQFINRIENPVSDSFPSSPACVNAIKLTKWDQMQEYLMVGFRLTDEGVSKKDFQDRFDQSIDNVFNNQVSLLMKQKLIEVHPEDQDRYRLTPKGRLFGNRVFGHFVGNDTPEGLDQ